MFATIRLDDRFNIFKFVTLNLRGKATNIGNVVNAVNGVVFDVNLGFAIDHLAFESALAIMVVFLYALTRFSLRTYGFTKEFFGWVVIFALVGSGVTQRVLHAF